MNTLETARDAVGHDPKDTQSLPLVEDLARFAIGGGWPEVGAFRQVRDGDRSEFLRGKALEFRPHLPDQASLGRVLKAINQHFSRALPYEEVEEIIQAIPQAETPTEDAVNDVQPVALGDFLAGPVPPVDWLVEGFIARGILVAVAGEPRSTKSWFANDLATAVASGQDFLGFRVPTPGRVLLVQEEDTKGELHRGLSQLCAGRSLDPLSLPIFIYHQVGMQIDNTVWEKQLIARIEQDPVDLLILDPFNYIHGQEEKDQYKMTRYVLQPILRLRQRFPGLTIVIVHHYRKETKEQSKRPAQMLRGTSALAGAVKNILGITRAGEARYRVDQDSKHGSVPPFLYTIEGQDDDPRRLVVCGTAEDAETQANAEKVLQAAQELYAEGGRESCTVKALSEKAKLTESTTRRAAKFYHEKGKLKEVEVKTEKKQTAKAYIPGDVPDEASDNLLGDVGTLPLHDDSLDNLPASPTGEGFSAAP